MRGRRTRYPCNPCNPWPGFPLRLCVNSSVDTRTLPSLTHLLRAQREDRVDVLSTRVRTNGPSRRTRRGQLDCRAALVSRVGRAEKTISRQGAKAQRTRTKAAERRIARAGRRPARHDTRVRGYEHAREHHVLVFASSRIANPARSAGLAMCHTAAASFQWSSPRPCDAATRICVIRVIRGPVFLCASAPPREFVRGQAYSALFDSHTPRAAR